MLLTDGTDWSVHLILGVIVMAGLAGSALAALVAGLSKLASGTDQDTIGRVTAGAEKG